MSRLTANEKQLIAEVLKRVIRNLENSTNTDKHLDQYMTDGSLNISCDGKTFKSLKNAFFKFNS